MTAADANGGGGAKGGGAAPHAPPGLVHRASGASGGPPAGSRVGSIVSVLSVKDDDHLVTYADWRSHSAVGRTASTLGEPVVGHSSWYAGVGHIICANVGAGVLSLPNAVAWLGWVAGPVMIVACTGVAMFCAELLTRAYRAKGQRRATYKDAITAQLIPPVANSIVTILYLKYFLVTVGYTVVAATGMVYIARYACGAAGAGSCPDQLWLHVVIFSGVQLALSQAPNLESVAGASAVGAVMSLLYTGIALALCFANVGKRMGSIGGRPAPTLEKVFGVFNALGSILFSNASAVLTIDIQHTMREPPPNDVTMRRVVRTAFGIAMGLYLATGTAGYVAVGDGVGSDILVEFENGSVPGVVPLLANIFTVVHFIPAYQVFAQPLFVILEQGLARAAPRLLAGKEWPVRLAYRSVYVCITATLAACLPFFGAISGLIGALAFWPTVVVGPILMYLSIRRPPRGRAAALGALMGVMFLIAAAALVGSVYGFVRASRSFKPFGARGAPH